MYSERGAGREESHARLAEFQSLLDESRFASERYVDLSRLRGLCSSGIPEHPPHLRPLAYALLLGAIPPQKASWRSSRRSQREAYYALVREHMEELESQPSTSACTHDGLLRQLARAAKSLKSSFWRGRSRPTRSSPFRPLTESYGGAATQDGEDGSSDSEDDDSHAHRPKLVCRRAVFKRIETLAEVDHRGGWASVRTGTPSTKSSVDCYGHDPPRPPPTPSAPEPDDQAMSPKITLSIDPSPILPRLAPVRPAPLSTSSLFPGMGNSLRPESMPGQGASPVEPEQKVSPPSPITLLAPKPLPTPSTGSLTPYSGSLYNPDTHLECLIRLVYALLRDHPQWTYQPAVLDVASVLYLVHTGGKAGLRHAEEQAFAILSRLMTELDTLTKVDLAPVMHSFASRLAWAHPAYADVLARRNLDPTLYAYRWIQHLFIRDLPASTILRILDHVLSEGSPDAQASCKLDVVVDIAVAMVLLLKDRLLASDKGQTTGLWTTATGDDEAEDEDAVFVRSLNLLRSYPLKAVGGVGAVLRLADQIRSERLAALGRGEVVDGGQGSMAQGGSAAGSSTSTNGLASNANAMSRDVVTPNTPSTWSKASSLFSYFSSSTVASPDSTVSAPSQARGFKPAALPTPSTEAQPGASRPGAADPSTQSSLGRGPAPSRRDHSHGASTIPSSASLSDRLASLTHSTPPARRLLEADKEAVQGLPRPLLLSGSARRPSGPLGVSIGGSGVPPSQVRRGSSGMAGHATPHGSPPVLSRTASRTGVSLSSSHGLDRVNGSSSGPVGQDPPKQLDSTVPSSLYKIGNRHRARSSLSSVGGDVNSPVTNHPRQNSDLRYE
ncbi:hypothetical protein IAU60_000188 [Kwoniella sp. DSM 27419]